jgi:hypothetical protein
MSQYSEMAYAELKAAAKELGLPATGTKEELLERLEGATPAETPEEPETETPEEPEAPEETEEEPEEPVAKAKVSDREVEKQWRGDAQKMKDHLAKQKKVSIMIPLEVGVAPEVAEKIPFIVNMNGYRFSIKRGVFVEVPEQVADMIKERLESEGKIGRNLRIDRNPNTLEALG